MGIINLTAEEVTARLNKADTAIQQSGLDAALQPVNNSIGSLSSLKTSAKDSLTEAVNELFTYAGEGKTAIASALSGQGQTASDSDSFSVLAEKIGNLKPQEYLNPSECIRARVTNESSVVPTGTYASSSYYNTSYGVKIGYMSNGDIILSMQGGTNANYEYLYFYAASLPSGVSLTTAYNSSSSYASSAPGMIYACVLSGITFDVTIALAMSTVNSTGDYVRVDITVTAA